MMTRVAMPRLSDSMEEGTIIRWLRADGDVVTQGEELVEIETDKATMVYEADGDGRLQIIAAPGTTLRVGAPIATLGEPVTDGRAHEAPSPAAADVNRGSPTLPGSSVADAAPVSPGRPGASPVARRFASRFQIPLENIQGSGPHGRVLKRDVEQAHERRGITQDNGGESATSPAVNRDAVQNTPLSRLQLTVARRMVESKATVPDFSAAVDVDMTSVLELHSSLKEYPGEGRPPSLNDVLLKACAVTLRDHPRVNGAFLDDRFELHERVNIGIAVATTTGLVVPVLTDADRRSLGSIASESWRLISRVRDQTVSPTELSGATFTISNLGMFGIDRFSGIVNAPNAAILCAGTIAPRAVVRNDAIISRPLMSVTLVSDHRIVYGADAARFLADLRRALEHAPAMACL
jgi:pyruvate dehydrogenase E2 component (dihydrolipoamide acetyltransferase)